MITVQDELTLAEKLLLAGHILGGISMALISIGAVLRKSNLPDSPLFSSRMSEGETIPKSVNRNSNLSNYWEK